jgi:fructose-bisphosphate aldolase class II
VPHELIDIINKYGGNMQKTMGVPIESLKKAISLGINKINVDTDGRLAVTAAIRKVFAEAPDKFDPRDYLSLAREALAAIIAQRMQDFGTQGHIKDVKMVTLNEMATIYKKR